MIDELIRVHMAPLLKMQGFRKNGFTWNRTVEYGVQVFDIQKGKYSDTTITVNMGILVADLWEICWAKPVPKFVGEVQCYPRFRLRYLLNGFERGYLDRWWEVSPGTIDGVGAEFKELLSSYCMPFYNAMGTKGDVANFVSEKFQDGLPLETIQRAVLLAMCEMDSSGVAWPMLESEYWGRFSKAARDRLAQYPNVPR